MTEQESKSGIEDIAQPAAQEFVDVNLLQDLTEKLAALERMGIDTSSRYRVVQPFEGRGFITSVETQGFPRSRNME